MLMWIGSLIISRLICWCGTVACYRLLCAVSCLLACCPWLPLLFAVVLSALYLLFAAVCVSDVPLW